MEQSTEIIAGIDEALRSLPRSKNDAPFRNIPFGERHRVGLTNDSQRPKAAQWELFTGKGWKASDKKGKKDKTSKIYCYL